MATVSKRTRAIRELLTPSKLYTPQEALDLFKKMPKTKFRESVDLAVNLGIDARKSDQAVRGSIVLPHGTGRNIRIAVITTSAHADAAKKAGANWLVLKILQSKSRAATLILTSYSLLQMQ